MGRTMALVALVALAPGMGSAQSLPIPVHEPRQLARASFGVYNPFAPMTYGNRGAGITMAQQKRASKKRKNIQRHRRQVRG